MPLTSFLSEWLTNTIWYQKLHEYLRATTPYHLIYQTPHVVIVINNGTAPPPNELHPGVQLTLYRHVFPTIRKIGILYSSRYNREWFNNTLELSTGMGVEIVGKAVHKSMHVISSLKEMILDIDALWLVSDPVVMPDKDIINAIFNACETFHVPVFAYHDAFAEYGAMLIVSVDDPTIGRQAADVASEMLTDDMGEDKVQLPAGSRVVLNLQKVNAYGLLYNEEALSTVNQIIE